MAPPLAELTAQAQTLTSAGDLVGARNVLARALDPRDVDPQRASPDAATAAALLARILIGLGDPHGARPWAGFAHAAENRLHGPSDDRTVAAAALHAAVLQRIGNHGRAAQIYHDLVGELTRRDGPDSPRVLAAAADLATAEHAAGHCTAARTRLAAAWRRHREVYGDAAAAGIKMLARLGAMERECGRVAESREHLALAQELCARYLPADHSLARQAAALADAPTSGRHTCGRVNQSAGPAGQPGPRALAPGPHGDPGAEVTDPRMLASGPHPGVAEFPAGAAVWHADRDGRGAPAGHASVGHASVGHASVGHASVGHVPVPDDRRLPVVVPGPQAPKRSRSPWLLIVVLLVGMVVAAAVVLLTLPRAAGRTTTTPPPSAAAGSAAPPPVTTPMSAAPDGGAPTGVKLKDNRDSVSLTWGYPTDSEGPVLISGGRVGQEQRAFQQLPAGTATYVVYGLNEKENYCFTVAVVYTTERVAASRPLCTGRG